MELNMLNENIDNQTGYIVINSDDWADVGQLYKVVEYSRNNPKSTAVELVIESSDGQTQRRVVPYHWIEWIPDGDW
jgi:hypothetical protein